MKYTILFIFLGSLFKVSAQGLLMDKEGYSKLEKWTPDENFGYASILPSKISYREFAPIPGYQGDVSTCTGWATAYGMLTTQQNILMGITDTMQRTVRSMDPNFIYQFIRDVDDDSCQNPTLMWDGLDVMVKHGCKPLLTEPFIECNSYEAFSDNSVSIASNYKVDEWYGLKMDANPIKGVKEALNSGYIVAVGMDLTNSFMTGKSVNDGLWNPNEKEDFIGGHAMCVIGYDNFKHGGSFEILNSYGTAYGDEGFIWVKYSDFEKFMNQAYIVEISGFQSEGCLYGDCENFGIYKTSEGGLYEGELKEGLPHARGMHIMSNGDFYVGSFTDGSRDGTGLFYLSSSSTYYAVVFSNGELVNSQLRQGYASKKLDLELTNNIYSRMSQFIPGKLITDEKQSLKDLQDYLDESAEGMILKK